VLEPGACPARVRVFARGDAYSGPVFFRTNEGACSFYFTQAAGVKKGALYAYTAELPATSFVAMPVVER
jgi:hypothetical protein